MRFLQAYNRYKKIFKEIRVNLLTFAPNKPKARAQQASG